MIWNLAEILISIIMRNDTKLNKVPRPTLIVAVMLFCCKNTYSFCFLLVNRPRYHSDKNLSHAAIFVIVRHSFRARSNLQNACLKVLMHAIKGEFKLKMQKHDRRKQIYGRGGGVSKKI